MQIHESIHEIAGKLPGIRLFLDIIAFYNRRSSKIFNNYAVDFLLKNIG